VFLVQPRSQGLSLPRSRETLGTRLFSVFTWRHGSHVRVQDSSGKSRFYYCAKLERHFAIVLYTNMAVSSREWKPRLWPLLIYMDSARALICQKSMFYERVKHKERVLLFFATLPLYHKANEEAQAVHYTVTEDPGHLRTCSSYFLHFPRVLKCRSCFITVQYTA